MYRATHRKIQRPTAASGRDAIATTTEYAASLMILTTAVMDAGMRRAGHRNDVESTTTIDDGIEGEVRVILHS